MERRRPGKTWHKALICAMNWRFLKSMRYPCFIIAAWSCSPTRLQDRTESSFTSGESMSQDVGITYSTEAAAEKNPMSEEAGSDEELIANEPISIGGAFLTCRYPQGQMQGSETYWMDCNVEKSVEINQAIARVEFYKVDASGTRTSLVVQSQNTVLLAWTLKEPAATMFLPTIELILYAANGTSASMTTTISGMNIERAARFWLSGEPNNTVENGEEEDCVEYQNLTAKRFNEAASGLSSGPLGRLNDNQCSTVQRFICKSTGAADGPKWIISSFQGPFLDYPKACPQGYRFALPMNNSEATSLNTLVDQNSNLVKYWVPLHDRDIEGKFVIILK